MIPVTKTEHAPNIKYALINKIAYYPASTVYVTTIYIEIISTLATAGSLIIYKATLKRSEGDKRALLYKDYLPFNKLWLLSS